MFLVNSWGICHVFFSFLKIFFLHTNSVHSLVSDLLGTWLFLSLLWMIFFYNITSKGKLLFHFMYNNFTDNLFVNLELFSWFSWSFKVCNTICKCSCHHKIKIKKNIFIFNFLMITALIFFFCHIILYWSECLEQV